MLVLDGVRGMAVLFVLLDHASDSEMQFFAGAELNRLGKYGVYLFFVLSAFLLTWQLFSRPSDDLVKGRTWINYAIRRALRIFPLYAVVIIAYFFMGRLDGSQVAPHLLLQEGDQHFWTIPVEVKFYILLPFASIALFWATRKHWLLGVCASLAAAGIWWAFFVWEQRWSFGDAVLLPFIAPFLCGSAAAVWFEFGRRRGAPRESNSWLWTVACTGAFALIVMRVPALHISLFSVKSPVDKIYDPLYCGVLWSVFLLGILHGRGVWTRIMQWGGLRYLGLISFSAYLWHRKFLSDVDDMPVPSVARLLIFIALVLAIATVSYLLIERPLANLAARWTKPAAR
jgi:peptidoglycan/LPS O-acetylase OafA/YrhL